MTYHQDLELDIWDKRKKGRFFVPLGLLALLPTLTWAAGNSTTLSVTITVLVPTCVLNANKAIEVNFRELVTNQINGMTYRLPIDYSLVCPTNGITAMKLQIQGEGTAFDSNALKTSVTGLGIRFQNGESLLRPNDWIAFNYPNKPRLYAFPIVNKNTVLSGGEFSAAATLSVDYQ